MGEMKLIIERMGKKSEKGDDEELNPKKALGENDIISLSDQDIYQIVNKGGLDTIMTPAGILTTDHKERGW